MRKVAPTIAVDTKWEAYQMNALKYIKETGKDREEGGYTHNAYTRAGRLGCLFVSIVTICLPCCAWDTTCTLMNCMGCKNDCYGCCCTCVGKSVDEAYKRNGHEYNGYLISREIVYRVCLQYMHSFNRCMLKSHVVEQAKRANLIRARLTRILQLTIDPSIVDTGAIADLQRHIYRI